LQAAIKVTETNSDGNEARVVALRNFHHLVIERAGNATLGILSDAIRHIIDRASEEIVDARAQAEESYLETAHRAHVQLLHFVESGRTADAIELWRKHLRHANAHMLELAGTHNVLDYLDP
jgi:DNA-binding FadR family transcriptional regulator